MKIKPSKLIAGLVISAFASVSGVSAQEGTDWSYQEVPNPDLAMDDEAFIGKEWFKRIEIPGFASAGYVKTDDAGTDPSGSFEVQEVNLFLDVDLARNIVFTYELEAVTAREDKTSPESQETYINFKDPFPGVESGLASFKLGRVDTPYGEEYVFQDDADDPLIDHTVNWPWARSEGLLAYGGKDEWGYMLGIFNGNFFRSDDNSAQKQYNAKVTYKPDSSLFFSASYMRSNSDDISSNWFGGLLLSPVGDSVVGKSPSKTIDADSYELDVIYKFEGGSKLWANFGQSLVHDPLDSNYDRTMSYYTGSAQLFLTPELYFVTRYSAWGTFDDDEGYLAVGYDYGSGYEYNYNTKSLQRTQFGFGYYIKANVIAKIEYHRDYFDFIDGYSLEGVDDQRDFFGAQAVVKF